MFVLWMGLALAAAPPGSKCKRLEVDNCVERAIELLDGDFGADAKQSGVAMLEKACGWSHGQACQVRGRLSNNDTLLDVDNAEALRWWQLGCDVGDTGSCNHAAVLLSKKGAFKDGTRAMALAERACTLDDMVGCDNVAWFLRQGIVDPPNDEAAMARHAQSCEGKYADGCVELGRLRLKSDDVQGAATAYQAGCALGLSKACNLQGVVLVDKLDRAADALKLFTKACDAGHSQACDNAGRVVHAGIFAGDVQHAQWRWTLRGCDLGFEPACERARYPDAIDGMWVLKGRVDGSQITPYRQLVGEGWVWGAEQWTVQGAQLTVTTYRGQRKQGDYWTAATTHEVSVQRNKSSLKWPEPASSNAAYEVAGQSTSVSSTLKGDFTFFRDWQKRSVTCVNGTCRNSAVVVRADGTRWVAIPVSAPIDLNEEVPW